MFDRVKISFVLALCCWLKRLANEGGEETGVPRNKQTNKQTNKKNKKKLTSSFRSQTGCFVHSLVLSMDGEANLFVCL